jgi:hypothetical protein
MKKNVYEHTVDIVTNISHVNITGKRKFSTHMCASESILRIEEM